MTDSAATFDRRAPYQGDQRRVELLAALDDLLRDNDLDRITIADISARAGVTRSAFYFYFRNKAECVAALGSEVYQGAVSAGARLFEAGVSREVRVRNMVDDLFAVLHTHRYLYRATLEAARTSASLREGWGAYRASFIDPIAEMIDDERAAGNAPAGPDARLLARMLLDLSDRSLERLLQDDAPDAATQAEGLATIWLRSIWGTVEGSADSTAEGAAGVTPAARAASRRTGSRRAKR